MYSIVMLTALSAGADVTPPAAAGAAPVVVAGTGCTGSYYAASSCHGCCGGGFFGMRHGGLLGHRSSCHGCTGSGYGASAGACYGGYACTGYTCFGTSYGSSCHGCRGAFFFNSCYGCGGGSVSYGSSWGPPVGMLPYTLHGYNSGVAPVYGPGAPVVFGNLTSSSAVYGNVYHPNQPPVMTVPVAPMTKPAGSDGMPNGANLKFKVPADAKLYVDGKLAPGTGPERSFYTPPLAAGQKFFYEVKAELVVNGKTVTEEKKVVVEAGASLTESFATLTAAVAKPDTVAGK